jgi:hypothetical protein
MDERVESDIVRTFDIRCDDAKRQKQNFLNLSRRYRSYREGEIYAEVIYNSKLNRIRKLKMSIYRLVQRPRSSG